MLWFTREIVCDYEGSVNRNRGALRLVGPSGPAPLGGLKPFQSCSDVNFSSGYRSRNVLASSFGNEARVAAAGVSLRRTTQP